MSIKLGFEPLLSGTKTSVESEVTDGTEGFEVGARLILRPLIEMGDGE